jgi:hypothetical protein
VFFEVVAAADNGIPTSPGAVVLSDKRQESLRALWQRAWIRVCCIGVIRDEQHFRLH